MLSKSQSTFSAEGVRVAILASRYHESITGRLALSAQQTFIELGGLETDCTVFQAEGAWELPILAKGVVEISKFDAIVALGCIIKGETSHDRVIGEAIADGLMRISLEWGRPISMGVLTCQTITQAEDRAGGAKGNKGEEAMRAAIGIAVTLRDLQS